MFDFKIFFYFFNFRFYKVMIVVCFLGVEIEIVGVKFLELGNWFWDFDVCEFFDDDKIELVCFEWIVVVGFSGLLFKIDSFFEVYFFGVVLVGFFGDGNVGIFELNLIFCVVVCCGLKEYGLLGDGLME